MSHRTPKPSTQRILGLDPGIARTGFAVLERRGSEQKLLVYGCINTERHSDYNKRLLQLEYEMNEILSTYKPAVAALEKLFFHKNTTTAMGVGQARGVLLLSLLKYGIVPLEFTPQKIKSSVTGYGKAEKRQVQKMVQLLLHLPTIPKPDDAADAIAVALTADAVGRIQRSS